MFKATYARANSVTTCDTQTRTSIKRKQDTMFDKKVKEPHMLSCPPVTFTPPPSKMNVNDVKMPAGEEEKLKKSLSILKEVFSSK